MKKRGFTLIELLAVITILAIILLIAFPIMFNVISSSKKSADRNSVQLYGKAIEIAVGEYYVKYPLKNTVTISELETEGLIDYKGKEVKCDEVQIINRKVYLNNCKVGTKSVEYAYGQLDPTPVLTGGLVPVVYDGTKWIVADESDDWYDYNNQKWANAVTLLPGITKNPGDEVKVDGTEASMMFVWIPRYEYKYTNLGNKYAGGTLEQPGTIDINFISKNTTTPSSNDYIIHPAFKFGTEELSGIWVSKFELSNINSVCNDFSCNLTINTTTSNISSLPNKTSISGTGANISYYFNLIKDIGNNSRFGLANVDTHMTKNSEWAAVAYLSQSKYGKRGNNNYSNNYKKIYLNSTTITGVSCGDVEKNGQTKFQYNDVSNKGEGKGQAGPGASTTGNITGVYDMYGANQEFVMGVYQSSDGTIALGESGFTSTDFANIDKKYYNLYKENSSASYPSNILCDGKNCYGHALFEIFDWFGINGYNFDTTFGWLERGESFASEKINKADMFAVRYTTGYGISSSANTRVVLVIHN